MTQSTTELCHLTIHEASGLLRDRKLSPVELTRAFLDRIEALDETLLAYITVLPESSMAEARRAEADILSGNYKGPLRHQRRAHHGQLEGHGQPRSRRGRHHHGPTQGRRLRASRQAGDARVRPRRARPNLRLPAGPQPLEPGAHAWRVQQRLWGVSGRRPGHGRTGLVHRRLHQGPRVPLQHRRTEGHLRPGESLRGRSAELDAGPLRAHDVDRRGCRTHASGYRRVRPRGPHHQPRARARLLIVPQGVSRGSGLAFPGTSSSPTTPGSTATPSPPRMRPSRPLKTWARTWKRLRCPH